MNKEKELTKHLRKLFSNSRKHRQDKVENEWKNSMDWFMGSQSLRRRGENAMPSNFAPIIYGESDTQTNLIFANLMTVIPFLSNRTPNVVLKPIVNTLAPHATETSSLINRIFHRNDVIDRQAEMVT